MIGDGMGLTHISAASYSTKRGLNMERFKTIGLQKTHCRDKLITDSAAGAAAMARGIKADYSTFGSSLETKAPISIMEELQDKGWATGITVTSSVTHATPAAFYSYQQSRAMYEEIALDLLEADVDYLVGGGLKYFERRDGDGRNLLDEMKTDGYQISTFLELPFSEVTIFNNAKFAYFTANEEPLQHTHGRHYLVEACQRGVQYLNRRTDEGFFFLVEGSQIDWGGHANDAEWIVDEVIDFDEAVGKMLDWVEKDGETLLLVTSDHETGGLAIVQEDEKGELILGFSTKDHTATMVPIFASGPGSELFQGTFDNTEIYLKMKQALGI